MGEKSSSSNSSGGIGLLGALFLVLLTLKLLGKITTSWLWVTAPLWGGVALVGAFIAFCLVMAALTGQLPSRK